MLIEVKLLKTLETPEEINKEFDNRFVYSAADKIYGGTLYSPNPKHIKSFIHKIRAEDKEAFKKKSRKKFFAFNDFIKWTKRLF